MASQQPLAGGRREQEASFFTVVVWRDQASMRPNRWAGAAGWWSWFDSSSGAGRLRTAAPRSVVEVLAAKLEPSLPWATTTRTTHKSDR
jgi:hypothetical protein